MYFYSVVLPMECDVLIPNAKNFLSNVDSYVFF